MQGSHNGHVRDAGGGHAGHMPPTGDARALVISGILAGVYFAVEPAVGLWSGSVSVLSDAFHTFSAVDGVLIALGAIRFGQRSATWFQTFGYLRAEIVGALFNGLFLVLMAIMVLRMGWMRLRISPPAPCSGPRLAES